MEKQEPKGRQDLLERMELTVLMELMELPVWTVATVPTEKREKQAPLDPPAMLVNQEKTQAKENKGPSEKKVSLVRL
ncbi:MAG: hypothetical protein CMJ52_09825 [Planctomycetaceae bacterium]|nr:hypothetical protein [Planctomycetaceae bacterium]